MRIPLWISGRLKCDVEGLANVLMGCFYRVKLSENVVLLQQRSPLSDNLLKYFATLCHIH